MAFTYSTAESSATHKVRGIIGDTIAKDGPRPGAIGSTDTNFSDEVIAATITQEKNWQRATANMFERLAAEWSKKASKNISSGGGSVGVNYNSVAGEFAKRAVEYRKRYGFVEDDDTVSGGVSTGVFRLGFQATNGT